MTQHKNLDDDVVTDFVVHAEREVFEVDAIADDERKILPVAVADDLQSLQVQERHHDTS